MMMLHTLHIHIIYYGWQISKIVKEAPQRCMQALRSYDSADKNLEHPNLVERNPGLITQDATQTVKQLGEKKRETAGWIAWKIYFLLK